MMQKTLQHIFALYNTGTIVYCQQKAFLTELVSSGKLNFT